MARHRTSPRQPHSSQREGAPAVALPDNPRRSLLPSKARALTLAGSAGRRGGAGHTSGSRVPLGSPPREETTACSRVSLSCWEELPVCLPSASNSGRAEPRADSRAWRSPACVRGHTSLPCQHQDCCPEHSAETSLTAHEAGTRRAPARNGAPAQGSAQPPTSPATADTGAFPRSKAQTSMRGRNHC